MTTCEGQNFIETLWETIFSSSSREIDGIRNFFRFLLNSELLKVILSSGETSKKDSFLFHKQFKILHKFSIYHQNICSYLRLKQLLTNQKVSKQTVKKILLEAHRHQWALDRNKCSDGKLRTYVKF
jgi:hypothetical protein